MGGFAGSVLRIDLTRLAIECSPLDMSLAERFGGGLGLAIRFAYEAVSPGVDALSPGNPIVLGAGPLVGTNAPASSRVFAVSKLPSSGSIGWCGAGGMSWGSMFKHAGYDHLLIEGRAERPVYIKIVDDTVELCDAGELWGKGIGETCELLSREMGSHCGIIAIGPAGENLCTFSMAYVDGISTLGRGGFGAVMGSKNLKAIAVKGTRGITVADRKRFHAITRELLESIRSYPFLREWQDLGLLKSLPVVSAEVYRKFRKRRIACVSCPIGDKDLIEIPDGDLKGFTACTSSAVNLLTPLIYGFTDYREAMWLTTLLDDQGMDVFEFFGLMGYVKTLAEQGIISPDMLPAPVSLNSLASLKVWAHAVSRREGLGDLIASGIRALQEEFGRAAGELSPPVVRGMLPYVGPAAPLPWNLFGTMELGQLLDPRGPHVAAGGSPTYFAKRPLNVFPQHFRRMGIPEDAIARVLPVSGQEGRPQTLKVGRLLKHSHTWFTILGTLGICARAQVNRFYNAGLCAELYQAATGIGTSVEDLRTRADRAWTLLKLANMREGFVKEQDAPPEQWFVKPGFLDYVTEQPIGPGQVMAMVEDYYDEQGWDRNTGEPLRDRLEDLGLIEELSGIRHWEK